MLAAEVLGAIERNLVELAQLHSQPLTSGQRAALWRAQQEAARRERSLDDLRRYCLEWLGRARVLRPDDESDYVRGFRLGLQAVLNEIRRIETVSAG